MTDATQTLIEARDWVVVVPSRVRNAAPSIVGPMTKEKAIATHELWEDAYYQKLQPPPEVIP